MKRTLLSLLLCGALLFGCVGALPVLADEPGDLDGDGYLTSKDARIVANYAMKLTDRLATEHPELADVNGDGEVTLTDARIILQYYAGYLPDAVSTTVKDAGALPADLFSISLPQFNPYDSTMKVKVHFNTTQYFLDGLFFFSYPTDQMELVLSDQSEQAYTQLTPLNSSTFNPEWDEDVVAVGFYDHNGHASDPKVETLVLDLTFRLKNPDVSVAPSLSVWADYMTAYDTQNGPTGYLYFAGGRDTMATVTMEIPTVSITPPSQTVYFLGENLNFEDGHIALTYKDGNVHYMSLAEDEVLIEGFDNSKLGVQTVTISYAGVSVTFEVEVIEPFIVYIGDVDLDGEVTSTDARIVLQYYVGKFTSEDIFALYGEEEGAEEVFCLLADADEDGTITSTDARLILQYYAGKL